MSAERERRMWVEELRENPWSASPVGDAMDAASLPEVDARGRPVKFSPGARAHRVVSPVVDQWIETPTVLAPPFWYEGDGFSFLLSNGPDRPPLPMRHGGYGDTELREQFIASGADNRADRARRLRQEEQFHTVAMTAAVTGPVLTRTVVVHSARATRFAPPVPHDGHGIAGTPTLVAYPVSQSWSTHRVIRHAVDLFPLTCEFCSDAVEHCTEFLMVTCGTVTHVGGTCTRCANELQPSVWTGELTFGIREFSGWYRDVGYCSDRHY